MWMWGTVFQFQAMPHGHTELFWALEGNFELRFEPAWSSVGVLCLKFMPVSHPRFARIAPAFGVLRGSLKTPLVLYYLCARYGWVLHK
jgi:hypothetical protein